MAGKQVKLFLVDGTPGGITTAEITNWTGHVVSGPRSKLADLMAREETKRTGAYLLLGDDPTAVGETRCYIGEADEIRTRLKEHASNRGKDFWNRVVIITSKDASLSVPQHRFEPGDAQGPRERRERSSLAPSWHSSRFASPPEFRDR